VPHYLDGFHVLILSYDGQKPLSPEVHAPLVDWVKRGGVLIFCDKDADPYLKVREWWNSDGNHHATPREELFEQLGLSDSVATNQFIPVKAGGLIWLQDRPADLTTSAEGAAKVIAVTKLAAKQTALKWRETNYLLLRRGPYVIAAGLDESIAAEAHELKGRFINLFDAELHVQNDIELSPGSRALLIDLDLARTGKPHLLASAGKALPNESSRNQISFTVEGIGGTPAIMLFESPKPPQAVTLDGKPLTTFEYSAKDRLLWIHFKNSVVPRELAVHY
jgi:hypothetical protein